MTVEFNLPDIGEGLHEAEIVEWLVSEGDEVERNQPFVEILTDKSQTEMPAPAAGTVLKLGAAVGDIIQVGDLLIEIDSGDAVSAPGAEDSPSGGTSDSASRSAKGNKSGDAGKAPGSDTREPGTDDVVPFDRPIPGTTIPGIPSPLASAARTGASGNGSSDSADHGGSDGRAETTTPRTFAAAIDGPDEAPTSPVLRPKASPSTRRLAVEAGVDLTRIAGTGPGGRILAADVQTAAANSERSASAVAGPAVPVAGAGATAAAGAVGVAAARGTAAAASQDTNVSVLQPGHYPLRGIRRATARAMDRSWSTIPHVTTMDEVDASELLLARRRIREVVGGGATKVTPLALMVAAVARAIRAFPVLNATLDLDAETIDVHNDINIGIAVASSRGLMVPIIRNADRLNVLGVAAEIARLSAGARDGSVGAEDLAGGTCTVTNYGSNGGYFAAPIIRPGEAAIVGFGAIADRPVVVDGDVVARPVLPVVISADHRLIDGDVLSAFQANLSAALTNAVSLLVTNN